jgi:hypothetical protein
MAEAGKSGAKWMEIAVFIALLLDSLGIQPIRNLPYPSPRGFTVLPFFSVVGAPRRFARSISQSAHSTGGSGVVRRPYVSSGEQWIVARLRVRQRAKRRVVDAGLLSLAAAMLTFAAASCSYVLLELAIRRCGRRFRYGDPAARAGQHA